MYVFRIENDKGLGPYREMDFDPGPLRYHSYETGQPPPWDDTDLFHQLPNNEYFWRKYLFAFVSLIQMLKWFKNRDREHLIKHGYHLAIYEVPDKFVYHSQFQAVFEKEYATKLMSRKLFSKRKIENETLPNCTPNDNVPSSALEFITQLVCGPPGGYLDGARSSNGVFAIGGPVRTTALC